MTVWLGKVLSVHLRLVIQFTVCLTLTLEPYAEICDHLRDIQCAADPSRIWLATAGHLSAHVVMTTPDDDLVRHHRNISSLKMSFYRFR